MGYVLKAVLSSAQHPEYGQITVLCWFSNGYKMVFFHNRTTRTNVL